MRWPKGVSGLCYGGDYNPEQWFEDVWREDVELMRRAGVNLVNVGVFAWSRLEPEEGHYTFGWLDRVLDLLADGGVKVALATPTASPPPWFSLAYPDALPVRGDGTRLLHGSRDTYCASAPAYRAACRRIAGALAERYAGHPALALWHVHNEYGTVCHCDHAAAAFRGWLRKEYGGLDALNDAWVSAFWSQHYSAWEQIFPPRATQYLPNPGQLLDFRRFWSDELLSAYVEQRDLLREATPDVPITTNYVIGGWVPVDHARWAREVDLVAIDHYPTDAGLGAEEQTAFGADLARSWAGGKPWLLMETAPNLVYTPERMHAKEPGRMIRHSLSHVARGSRGAMFFQWRAPRGGAERYHSALVPHAGPDSRVYREAVRLGDCLSRLTEVDGAPIEASVAIAWDAASWWALQAPGMPMEVDYAAEVQAAHRALWRAGVTTDLVALTDPLPHRLLVLPAHYLLSDDAAAAIRAYVAGGGHLVATYLSGVADEHGRIRLGGYPGALRDVLGVRVEEFQPSPDGWAELVRLAGASQVRPGVTRHGYGAGVAWYISARLDDGAYQDVLTEAARGAGVAAGGVPGVEVVRRGGGWVFALNHTDQAHEIPAEGVDVLTGVAVTGVLTLPAGAYAVLRPTPDLAERRAERA
ncbi:beta-galactosidase [Micromonospora sp. CPCC 206061]|uniref:beta-galactosidase n=1 Tax=Micromonospora sp. CPCC 206061 TaxID=3122410 RepID=UPI002FF31DD2